jgi:hypothetical protein
MRFSGQVVDNPSAGGDLVIGVIRIGHGDPVRGESAKLLPANPRGLPREIPSTVGKAEIRAGFRRIERFRPANRFLTVIIAIGDSLQDRSTDQRKDGDKEHGHKQGIARAPVAQSQ